MDKIEALGGALSQITMYDIKSYYNQVRFDFSPVVRSQADSAFPNRLGTW